MAGKKDKSKAKDKTRRGTQSKVRKTQNTKEIPRLASACHVPGRASVTL